MLKIGIFLGAIGFLLISEAYGQTAISGAASQSGAQAGAGAQAGSAAQINQTFQGPPATTRNTLGYEGEFRQNYRATIRNTPDAYAPAITGGTNPCTNGVSGGGSVAGFGLALGGSWSDPNCERRNLSALLHNQGQPELAQEVLCETDAVRQARLRMAQAGRGQPCIADIPAVQVNAVRMQTAPTPQASVAVPAAAATRPAWCDTATPAERRQYRSTCG